MTKEKEEVCKIKTKKLTRSVYQLLFFIFMACIYHHDASAKGIGHLQMERIKGFPVSEKGIEKGVSACFAGIVDGYLIMAGGCNFPDVPAADGGKKKFYQGIYAAKISTTADTLDWQLIGKLPEPFAYGVSVSLPNGLLCMGGCNAEGSSDQVFKITIEQGKAVVESYPALPWKLDNFAGSLGCSTVMVYDGLHIAQLQLEDLQKGWQILSPMTSEVLGQPVCGYTDGAFYAWGGCTTKTDKQDAQLQMQGYQFTKSGAKPVEGPRTCQQEEIYLGGAAAVNCGDSGIVVLGGVNKDVFEAAVNRPMPGYMKHPIAWYRFNPYINLYKNGKWTLLGSHEAAARAGASLVFDGTHIYIIGGELKPGIRTAEIYRFRLPL